MQSKSRDGSFFCDVLYGVRSACLFLIYVMMVFFFSERIPYPREERRGNFLGSPKSSGRSRWELFCLQEDETAV